MLGRRAPSGREARSPDRGSQPSAPRGVQKTGAAGKIYDVAFMQFFQADLLRGKGLNSAGGTPALAPDHGVEDPYSPES